MIHETVIQQEEHKMQYLPLSSTLFFNLFFSFFFFCLFRELFCFSSLLISSRLFKKNFRQPVEI